MCHAYHYDDRARRLMEDEFERSDLRASDAERERVVEALRGHAQAGRLTADELDQRVGAALAAKTRGDLATLLEDLPSERRVYPPPPRAHRAPSPSLVPIVLLLIAIWAVTGAGYFWPIWPLLWFGFAFFARGGSHIRVTSHTRRTW
jgi:hypothetical protein